MNFTVNNGELSVKKVAITYITTSSTFFVGDIERVALSSAFETPPEDVIIGVTVPFVADGS